MNVENRMANFLRTNSKQPYCDDCLGRLLDLGSGGNRHMARNATAALGESGAFTRQHGACSKCAKTKMVTHAN